MRGIVFLITDPLYLPLKRGGLVCLPLESVMVRRNKSVFICGIRGRAFIRDYSLENISLDLCSHRLHGFSQIFCCLGNSYLQMSGCVVHMKLISVGLITDPLYLPLKWGGQVCPPLERAMIWRTGLSAS